MNYQMYPELMKKGKKLTFHLCVHHLSGIILEMSLQEIYLRITKDERHNLETINVGEIEQDRIKLLKKIFME